VIEEAPAPGMDEATRAQLCETAVRAAKAVDYVGAGTIEFIADASEGLRADRIWFMEMNTRLQVEHPVTEEITGVDLVEWQLRVASGEALPRRQDELSINGWAMEARLYAEDPAKGFLPSVGRLDWLVIKAGEGRVETGVVQDDEVSSFYDPMIAKLIGTGPSRADAIEALRAKLLNINVWPVRTNSGFLYRAATHPDFRAERIDTGFIERHLDALLPPDLPCEAALTQGLYLLQWHDQNWEDTPWDGGLHGFRIGGSPKSYALVLVDGKPARVLLHNNPHWDGRSDEPAGMALVNDNGQTYAFFPWRIDGENSAHTTSGTILSPMPGRIIAVDVAAGDMVVKGQKLVTLEAMKMEHTLTAPFDGVVAELNAETGAQVQVEAVLVRIEAAVE